MWMDTRRLWRQWIAGPLMTVGILSVLIGIERYGLPIPTPVPFYFAVVVCSAVVSGLWAGLSSSVLALLHALWFFSNPGAPWHYTYDSTLALGVLAGMVPMTAIMVGLLKRRADRTLQVAMREETKYRAIMQSAVDAIILADNHGCMLTWSDGARRIFGYEVEEVLGQPLSILMPERYRGAHQQGIERVRATGESQLIGRVFALHGQRRDGSEFPLELSLASWTTEEGRFFTGIIRDSTESKQAEEALRASETRFRQLIEGSIQGVIIHRHYRPLFVNQAYAAMFGYTPDEILALESTMALFAPKEQGRLRSYHEARMRGEAAPTYYEFRGIKKDGSVIWLECCARAVDWQGSSATQGTVVDITERKRAEEALRRANDELERRVRERTADLVTANEALELEIAERQRAEEALQQYAERIGILHEIDRAILTAQSTEAITQASLDHICALLSCWRAGISLFDFQTDQGIVLASVGRHVARFPIGTRIWLQEYGERDLQALQAGEVYTVADVQTLAPCPITVQALQADGLRSYSRLPLMGQGELVGSLNLWSDKPGAFTAEQLAIAREVADQLAISIQQAHLLEQVQSHAAELEQRVAERTAELREINAELESFSYSVSHDLRAPLRAIQGFSQVLLEDYADGLGQEGQEYARRIVTAAQRMNTMIGDLLAYSHLSRADLRLQPVDLATVVADVLTQLEAELQAHEAEMWVEGELPQVAGHPATVHQVVANLVTNAVKFVAPGIRPEVRIRGEARCERIRLWVEDNGIGIAAEYQERIFGLFERLHSNRTYPGTGIGLATVSKGMARMGGRAGVESEVGRGSRFWVEFAPDVRSDREERR